MTPTSRGDRDPALSRHWQTWRRGYARSDDPALDRSRTRWITRMLTSQMARVGRAIYPRRVATVDDDCGVIGEDCSVGTSRRFARTLGAPVRQDTGGHAGPNNATRQPRHRQGIASKQAEVARSISRVGECLHSRDGREGRRDRWFDPRAHYGEAANSCDRNRSPKVDVDRMNNRARRAVQTGEQRACAVRLEPSRIRGAHHHPREEDVRGHA